MEFNLPPELIALTESRFWPRSSIEVNLQETQPTIKKEIVNEIFCDEDFLVFYQLPFSTAYDCAPDVGKNMAKAFADGTLVNLKSLVVLGDFGSGTDSMFGLYYKDTEYPPIVVREKWNFSVQPITTHWQVVFEDFSDFIEKLQINTD